MKSRVILIAIVITVFISWFTGLINNLSDNLESTPTDKSEFEVSEEEGSLSLTSLAEVEKKALWNKSNLKQTMLAYSPSFLNMKYLVEDQIEDTGRFKNKLLKHIEDVEREFVSGTISSDLAKEKLANY